MTKKDFELIAKAVHDAQYLTDGTRRGRLAVAHKLATALESTNSRFDRERFLQACGVAE